MKPTTNAWALYASHLGAYMRRWILRTPWFNLRLHNIRESDEGRDFHDHPFTFTSIILRGGYIEHRPGCSCIAWPPAPFTSWNGTAIVYAPCETFKAPAIVHRKAEDLHRLELLDGNAWTFVIAGPYRRDWGFQTAAGWVPFQEYHRSFYQGNES